MINNLEELYDSLFCQNDFVTMCGKPLYERADSCSKDPKPYRFRADPAWQEQKLEFAQEVF